MSNERIKERNQWSKPEITILLRNKPDEAVLLGCKGTGQGGPDGADGGCYIDCKNCNAKVES